MVSYRLRQFGFKLAKLSSQETLSTIAEPQRVYLPCLQHAGAPTEAVVAIGQKVERGEVVAIRKDGLAVHASVQGTVIGKESMQLADGRQSQVIVIENDHGLTEKKILENNVKDLAPEAILRLIQQAGVVGMGGAGFPTSIKASAVLQKKCQYLILNASECEPGLFCDRMLLRQEMERVIQGLVVLQHLSQAPSCYIAMLKSEKELAVSIEKRAAEEKIKLRSVLLPDRYTMGSEKIIIQACTGQQVANGQLPIDVGVLLFNVASTAAVADAVFRNQPLTERFITLGGSALKQSYSLKVPLGMLLSDILKQLKIEFKNGKVIVGGPMMGFATNTLDLPVSKTTTGFLLEKPPKQHAQKNCIHCGACFPVCPVNLQPALLFELLKSNQSEQAQKHGLRSCLECGACSAVCPSSIPLSHTFRQGKRALLSPK